MPNFSPLEEADMLCPSLPCLLVFINLHCCVYTYILMLLLALFFTYCTPAPFCILCTRLKSCFGGFNEQSGYLGLNKNINDDAAEKNVINEDA